MTEEPRKVYISQTKHPDGRMLRMKVGGGTIKSKKKKKKDVQLFNIKL